MLSKREGERSVRAVPVEETAYPFLDLYLVMPAQGVKLLHRGQLAHRPIGLGVIPLDLTGEAHRLGDEPS